MAYSYDALRVVGLCTVVTLMQELVMYLLLYRTSHFKSLRSQVEKQARKLDELKSKEATSGLRKEKRRKKEERLEESMKKDVMKALGPQRLQTGVVTFVFVGILYQLVSSWFDGAPVAKLPFEPFAMLRKVTHRGLTGTDTTECSVAFIYLLCQLGVRPLVGKFLAWGPSRAMNSINGYQGTPMEQKLKGMQ